MGNKSNFKKSVISKREDIDLLDEKEDVVLVYWKNTNDVKVENKNLLTKMSIREGVQVEKE